jgi:hypothetical protein
MLAYMHDSLASRRGVFLFISTRRLDMDRHDVFELSGCFPRPIADTKHCSSFSERGMLDLCCLEWRHAACRRHQVPGTKPRRMEFFLAHIDIQHLLFSYTVLTEPLNLWLLLNEPPLDHAFVRS